MKPRHFFMMLALAGAAWLAFFGDKTPTANIAEPIARASKPAPSVVNGKAVSPPAPATGSRIAKVGHSPEVLILQPRATLIGSAAVTAAASAPDALFATQSWTPPPPPPPKPTPTPPPAAPPMPFTYLGKKVEDGNWEVYIARGDQTFIVHEKTTIEDKYQVDSIKPSLLTLTYLPLKQVQTLNIGSPN